MKLVTLILLTSFFSMNFVFSQTHHFKFIEKDKNKINTVITRIISIDNVRGDTVIAYANDNEFAKFEKLGYKIENIVPNNYTKETCATTIAEMANWNKYPSYELYETMMNYYANTYPSICKLITIGTTVQGRKLLALQISDNVNSEENEAEFFYSSTIHGDETTGFVLMLRLADSLLTTYVTDTRIQTLVNNLEIYICPNANPDGTYYTYNNQISGTYSKRYNKNIVDINRNFPDPVAGLHPDGEQHQPETAAMMTFADNHSIVMGANFHGGEEVINYPWDSWTSVRKHADDEWLKYVSLGYAVPAQNASTGTNYLRYLEGAPNPSGITEGGDWYVISGGRQDYMTFYKHAREITIEISNVKCVSSSTLPTYWKYNKESLLAFMENCYYGIHGIVKNIDNQPLKAKITIENHDKDSSEVYCDPQVGDYHRLIAPGTYDVTYSCNGYISQTHTITVSNWTSAVTKDVILLKASSGNEELKGQDLVKIIPNPGNGIFHLEIPSGFSFNKLEIKNINGQIVYKSIINSNSQTFDAGNLSKGIYILQISNSSILISRQLVII